MTSKCETIIKDVEKEQEFSKHCIGVGRTLVAPVDVDITIDNPIKDGWYNSFRLEDNCVVEVRNADEVTIAAPACSPTPAPCGGGNGGGSVSISSNRGNLLSFADDGLYASVSFKAGAGVSISGNGTGASPITISVSNDGESGSPTIVAPTGGGINLTTVGNSYSLTLEPTGVVSGQYGIFELNSYGQVVSIKEDADDGEGNNIVGGDGIAIEDNGPISTISLANIHNESMSVLTDSHEVDFDTTGRAVAFRAREYPNLKAGIYSMDKVDTITVNELGSITKITLKEAESPTRNAPITLTRAFGGPRDEDIIDFDTTLPSSFSVDIYSSEITSASDISVLMNNIMVQVYLVGAGHAIAIVPTKYGAGSHELTVRYKDIVRSNTIIRITQEISHAS